MQLGHKKLFGAVSIVALVAAGNTASAQEVDPDRSGARLDQIVVTARKIEENLQDTPVSVTAITGDQLESRSALTFRDLAAQTPSLRLTQMSTSASSTTVSLRGLVYLDIRVNADLAAGLYLDEVYLPRSVGIDAAELLDIERVEVLKGPQGTLFGRNTVGGAVNIFTKQPENEFSGFVKARAGSHGDYGMAGVLNVPLSDTLAARFVLNKSGRSGYGVNAYNGDRLGERDTDSIRGSIKWEPSSNFSVLLRGDYTDVKATQNAFKPVTVVPTSTGVRQIAAETGLSLEDSAALYLSYSGGDPYDGNTNGTSGDMVEVYGGSVTANWQISDNINLKSITAYRAFDRVSVTDLDSSPFEIFLYDPYHTNDEQFSEELQLSGTALSGRLSWITGGYWSREKGYEDGDQYTVTSLSMSWPSVTYGEVVNSTIGIFAQGTYSILDNLSVTAGVRQTWDKRDLYSANSTRTTCTTLGVSFAMLGAAPCERTVPRLSTDAISYTFSVQYQATDDLMFYAKTNRGYRTGAQALTGGSAVSPTLADASYAPALPEYVTDYEVGVKSEWFDNRVRANFAWYTSDYTDIQLTSLASVPGTTAFVSRTQNIAAATISGFELEVSAVPIEGLELFATLGHTSPRYTDYVVNGVDLSKVGRIYMAVPWTYSLSGAYTAETVLGPLRTQLDYNYTDDVPTSGNFGNIPAHGLLNGRISLHWEDLNADVSLFARNLTDKYHYISQTDLSSLIGVVGISGPPRTWGVEFKKSF